MTEDNARSEVDRLIDSVKDELRSLFGKNEEQIKKLGNALKKVVKKERDVCEEIKNALKEEIAEGLISSRTIELCCPPEWKRKTKPRKEKKATPENEKSSFSSSSENISPPQVAATNEGISVNINETSADEDTHTEEPERRSDHCQSQLSPNTVQTDDQAQHDTDDTLPDRQDAANNKHVAQNETENLSNQVQRESKDVEFDFSMPFEDLRSAMEELFRMTKGLGEVQFRGSLNTITGKVIIIFCGNNKDEFFGCEGRGNILRSNTSGLDIIQ